MTNSTLNSFQMKDADFQSKLKIDPSTLFSVGIEAAEGFQQRKYLQKILSIDPLELTNLEFIIEYLFKIHNSITATLNLLMRSTSSYLCVYF